MKLFYRMNDQLMIRGLEVVLLLLARRIITFRQIIMLQNMRCQLYFIHLRGGVFYFTVYLNI